jgi:hypothetical protein
MLTAPTAPTNPTTGVPATAPLLTTGTALGAPTIHSDYKEFYGDVRVHPLWTPNYAPFLDVMTVLPAATTISGADICRGIRDNQTRQNFMCMGLFADPTDPASVGRIEVIHRITYLSAPFNGATDPTIHDKLYGIVGDLRTGRQVAQVIIPSSALDVTPAVLIASDQVFQAATSSGALPETYGPYLAAGVDNVVTYTRYLCFITPHVAALVLKSADRTPRGILQLLGPAVDLAHYEPMFKWLRVAQTLDGNGRALTTKAPFPSAPHRDEVNDIIMSIVGRDIPKMGHEPIHQVGQEISNAVGYLTSTYVAQREADRQSLNESSQPKVMTMDKKFTFQAAPLKNLLQITDLDQAPAVWKVIAANSVKQVRQILQTALNDTCFRLHLKAPILHQALSRIIVDPSLWHCSDDPDNVLQGFSIFHVLLRPVADERKRMQAAASYDLAMSTDSSLTSQDTSHFNHPGHVDTTWVDPLVAKMTLKHMWALCVTILGDNHTVTLGLMLALQRWDQYEMTLHNKYSCAPDTWTMQILYWFHRQIAHWINNQYHGDLPVPFEVDSLFSDILMNNHWSRGMPTEYVPARLLPSSSPSLISGLPPSSTPPPPPPTPPEETVRQPLAHKVAQIAAFAALQNHRRLTSIIASAIAAGNHMPKDTNNEHFCLTYHILGKCSQNCQRIRSHRKLTDLEVASLATWCGLAF